MHQQRNNRSLLLSCFLSRYKAQSIQSARWQAIHASDAVVRLAAESQLRDSLQAL